MTHYEEIEAVLPFERSQAIDADQIFEQCKGIDDRNVLSSLLSYMFNKRKTIERAECEVKGRKRYLYWKKSQRSSSKAKPEQETVANSTTASDGFEVPAFLKKDTGISTAPYIEKAATPAETVQETIKEEAAPIAPAPYQLTLNVAAAADLLLSTLPEYSEIRIVRESANNTRISLSLDDGNHLLVNLQPVDIQISLDAFATLQRYKDQQ